MKGRVPGHNVPVSVRKEVMRKDKEKGGKSQNVQQQSLLSDSLQHKQLGRAGCDSVMRPRYCDVPLDKCSTRVLTRVTFALVSTVPNL